MWECLMFFKMLLDSLFFELRFFVSDKSFNISGLVLDGFLFKLLFFFIC